MVPAGVVHRRQDGARHLLLDGTTLARWPRRALGCRGHCPLGAFLQFWVEGRVAVLDEFHAFPRQVVEDALVGHPVATAGVGIPVEHVEDVEDALGLAGELLDQEADLNVSESTRAAGAVVAARRVGDATAPAQR